MRILSFLSDNLPSLRELLLGGTLGLTWSFACLWFAGWLKRRGVRTGYTRKVFHFLVFGTVALLQWARGTPAVCLFGSMCSIAIFFAVWQGKGNLFYEALAREKDEPRRTLFIMVPYFTTLVGGVVSSVFFGPAALAGYLVTGLGDAVGEPVGTRFGRHPYKVPSFAGVVATRSAEGSLAVFVASTVALLLAISLLPGLDLSTGVLSKIVVIAAVSAGAEAISPHGLNNFTMQVVPSALVWGWM